MWLTAVACQALVLELKIFVVLVRQSVECQMRLAEYEASLHLVLHRYQSWGDYSRQDVHCNRSGMPGCLCECSNGSDQRQLLCECSSRLCR